MEGVERTERESEHFIFLVRVQATCAHSRPDTYFAVERHSGARVFVKGPYPDKVTADVPLQVASLKRMCFTSLACIDLRQICLLPDFFPDVPLGVRCKVNRNHPQWFVVADCLLKDDPIPVREHSLKRWGNVVDWDKVVEPKVPDPLKLKSKSLRSWVLNVLFRYAVGVPDQADRNFLLMKDGELFSADEEGFARDSSFYNSLKKNRCALIRQFIKDNNTEILSITSDWLYAVKQNYASVCEILKMKDVSWLIERLDKLQTFGKIVPIFSQEK